MSKSVLLTPRSALFVIAFLSLSAVVLSIWQAWSYYSSRLDRQSLIEDSALEFNNNLKQSTKYYFSGIFSSFYLVSRSSTLQLINSASSLPESDLAILFTDFLRSNINVYQIRYINNSGHELLRVDRVDGKPQLTKHNALQYKGDRDYFTQGMASDIGKFYISELDLNVENGQIEIPWRATLRAATPVDLNSDSVKDGLLVINIDTEELLALYASQDSRINDRNVINKLTVFNEQGYLIYGVERERLWGFMFDTDNKVSTFYPEAWKSISQGNSDTLFRAENSVWAISENQISSFLPGELQYQAPSQPAWHFLVQSSNVSGGLSLVSNSLPILILLVLLLLSLGWSKSVAQKRITEKSLLSAEKLASLGSLVAGISHELNTPIGSAVTITSTLSGISNSFREKIATNTVNKSSIINYINDVEEASTLSLRSLNRAAELISDFKQVSVDQTSINRREFELDSYIAHFANTVAHMFKHTNKTLELELNADITMQSYPGPLSQVLMNLIQNSLVHGFEPMESGTISICTSLVEDNKVLISIQDNGKGIENEIIERVFEPFFTTKLGSGGSGLGLHLVHNIVQNVLGGNISLTSNRKKRMTIFSIFIPVSAPELSLEQDNFYRATLS